MNSYRSRLLLGFIAVFTLAFTLAACGGEEPAPTAEPPPPTAEPAPTEAPEPTNEPEPTEVPTEEPEPTEEPAPVAALQEFSNEESGITIGYPEGWVTDDSMGGFFVFASSQAAIDADEPGATDGVALVFSGESAEFGSDDPVAALESFIPEMGLESDGLREGPTAVTMNGNPAATAIVDSESDSGVPLTAYLTLVIDGDWAAIFVGTSPTDVEADYLDTFTAMAETIELTEPLVSEESTESGDEALLESDGIVFYGDTLEVTLSEDGSDTWEFIGVEGEVVDIVVEPATNELDVVLNILDENGNSQLEYPMDDSFGKEEIVGFEIPSSGYFYITVESYDGSIGDYTFALAESSDGTLSEAADSEPLSESGDSTFVESGSAIIYSGIYSSSVSGEEAATFTFEGKAGEFADVSVAPLTEELDIVVELLDPSGKSLLDFPVDDSYDSEYIRLQRMPEDGEYTVVVTSFDGTAGEFELLVEESYLSQPASFVLTGGTITEAEDSHEFPFYTYVDELVIVQVSPDEELDAIIQLYNTDTEELIQEEDASTGFEEIVFFVPEDGNYSFRILGYEGTTGDYDINLIGSETVYFELASGDLVNGRFGDMNLFEYYIGGSTGDEVTITAKTEDDLDLVLELVDFDNNSLVKQDDTSIGEDESFTYTFEEDQILILRVSDFTESGSGKFIFTVE